MFRAPNGLVSEKSWMELSSAFQWCLATEHGDSLFLYNSFDNGGQLSAPSTVSSLISLCNSISITPYTAQNGLAESVRGNISSAQEVRGVSTTLRGAASEQIVAH
jgi:hypothetical protein